MTTINSQAKNIIKNKNSPGVVEKEKGMLVIEKSSLKTYNADRFSQLKVVSRYLKTKS